MERLVVLVFVVAIGLGIEAGLAQLVLFWVGSFHLIQMGFSQAFSGVVLLSVIAGGSAKASK